MYRKLIKDSGLPKQSDNNSIYVNMVVHAYKSSFGELDIKN